MSRPSSQRRAPPPKPHFVSLALGEWSRLAAERCPPRSGASVPPNNCTRWAPSLGSTTQRSPRVFVASLRAHIAPVVSGGERCPRTGEAAGRAVAPATAGVHFSKHLPHLQQAERRRPAGHRGHCAETEHEVATIWPQMPCERQVDYELRAPLRRSKSEQAIGAVVEAVFCGPRQAPRPGGQVGKVVVESLKEEQCRRGQIGAARWALLCEQSRGGLGVGDTGPFDTVSGAIGCSRLDPDVSGWPLSDKAAMVVGGCEPTGAFRQYRVSLFLSTNDGEFYSKCGAEPDAYGLVPASDARQAARTGRRHPRELGGAVNEQLGELLRAALHGLGPLAPVARLSLGGHLFVWPCLGCLGWSLCAFDSACTALASVAVEFFFWRGVWRWGFAPHPLFTTLGAGVGKGGRTPRPNRTQPTGMSGDRPSPTDPTSWAKRAVSRCAVVYRGACVDVCSRVGVWR